MYLESNAVCILLFIYVSSWIWVFNYISNFLLGLPFILIYNRKLLES